MNTQEYDLQSAWARTKEIRDRIEKNRVKAWTQKGYGFGYGRTFDQEYMSEREHAICKGLPHGSGIDYDWEISRHKNGKLRLENAFHFMNELGYYMGSLPFAVTIDANDLECAHTFRLTFQVTSSGYYWIERLGLRDYLEDTIAYCISEAVGG